VHIPGPESLVIQPDGKLAQGGIPTGIPIEQLGHCWPFYEVNMNSSRMLRVTETFPFTFLTCPAGLIAERDASGVLTFMSALIQTFTDMIGKCTGEILGKRTQHLGK
jgi:hypothetical protein